MLFWAVRHSPGVTGANRGYVRLLTGDFRIEDIKEAVFH